MRINDLKHPYMQDHNWKSGKLCYWRNNPNYSKKEQEKLEKRMKDMVNWRKEVKLFGYERN